MKNNAPSTIGKEIIKSLKDNGLLLLQDKTFPNVVSTIIKGPIKGSWWGHPMGNSIYNGLNWAIDNSSILSVKLLSKKVTYIDKSLYPFLFSIVSAVRPWQMQGMNEDAAEIFKIIKKRKNGIRSDDEELKLRWPLFKKHIEDLETRLLVYTREVHTEGGKHVKEIKSWAKADLFQGELPSYESSLEMLSSLVAKLNKETDSKIKLPWNKK